MKAIVTLGLLGFLLRRMFLRDGVEVLAERASHLALGWILVAIALHFASAMAGVLRWRVLLRERGLELPLAFLVRSFLVGRFVGAFTPSTAGLDGYRLWDVGRRTGDYARSGAVIVVEKLVGLVGMASVCLALLPFGLFERLGVGGVLVALAMALSAALGLFVLSSPARAASLAALAPARLRPRATKIADAMAGGASPRALGAALLLGIASHAALSATFAASGLAVGIDLSPLTLLGVGNAIVISVLLPISIGGIGIREGVAVALLVAAGDGSVATTDAMLLALVGYLTGQAPALVGGLLLAASRSPGAGAVGAPRSEDAPPSEPPTKLARAVQA